MIAEADSIAMEAAAWTCGKAERFSRRMNRLNRKLTRLEIAQANYLLGRLKLAKADLERFCE